MKNRNFSEEKKVFLWLKKNKIKVVTAKKQNNERYRMKNKRKMKGSLHQKVAKRS